MKRITFWPQAFLGLTFNFGALLGSSAVLGFIHPFVAIPLYLSGVAWTIVYDSIYALQDKSDDIKVGVKSTARLFSDSLFYNLNYDVFNLKRAWNHLTPSTRFKVCVSAFACISIGCLTLAGFMNQHGPIFYGVSVFGAAVHYIWQISTLLPFDVRDANRKFRANTYWGLVVTIGICLDWIYKSL